MVSVDTNTWEHCAIAHWTMEASRYGTIVGVEGFENNRVAYAGLERAARYMDRVNHLPEI